MHAGRVRRSKALALGAVLLALSGAAGAAEPDPCARSASVSPCFDADAWWLPAGRATFVGFGSPRALEAGELSLVLGAALLRRPVSLTAPSPHPEGREIDVVSTTSTLTLGGRVGLGRGIDAGLVVPFVPYQHGTGAEGVTAQRSDGLTSPALRDPRVGVGATLLGRNEDAPFALGTKLELALPLGRASALAGAAGPTLAPSFGAEFVTGPLTFGAELGARLRKAVQFADVSSGSQAYFAAGAAVTLLRAPFVLAAGLEASLSPRLTARSPAAANGAVDLPAEWLAHVRFAPDPAWTFHLAGGSGIPVSRAPTPSGSTESSLAVTAPSLRLQAAARYAFSL